MGGLLQCCRKAAARATGRHHFFAPPAKKKREASKREPPLSHHKDKDDGGQEEEEEDEAEETKHVEEEDDTSKTTTHDVLENTKKNGDSPPPKKQPSKKKKTRRRRPTAVADWRTVGADRFRVRSRGYASHGRKEPSQTTLYEPHKIYVFKFKQKPHVSWARVVPLPRKRRRRLPAVLVVTALLPDDVGPFRAGPDAGGPGHAVVFVFRLKDDAASFPLLERFCRDAPEEAQEAPDVRGLFKVIAGVEDASKLPALARSYNYKPALITKSGTYRKVTDSVAEMQISIFRFAYTSRYGLSLVAPTFPDLVLNLAFLVEARADRDLPERVLAACQLRHLDFAGTEVNDLADFMPPVAPRASLRRPSQSSSLVAEEETPVSVVE